VHVQNVFSEQLFHKFDIIQTLFSKPIISKNVEKIQSLEVVKSFDYIKKSQRALQKFMVINLGTLWLLSNKTQMASQTFNLLLSRAFVLFRPIHM